mmetsp:Transcript_43541/g.100243  ORF Transcript_43541/g.100243 Transcript_43541/m.100243 type:complete len:202 (-) Transcript_43541:33-638(-)
MLQLALFAGLVLSLGQHLSAGEVDGNDALRRGHEIQIRSARTATSRGAEPSEDSMRIKRSFVLEHARPNIHVLSDGRVELLHGDTERMQIQAVEKAALDGVVHLAHRSNSSSRSEELVCPNEISGGAYDSCQTTGPPGVPCDGDAFCVTKYKGTDSCVVHKLVTDEETESVFCCCKAVGNAERPTTPEPTTSIEVNEKVNG